MNGPLCREHVQTFFKKPREQKPKVPERMRWVKRRSWSDPEWRRVRRWVMDRAKGRCEARIDGVCWGRAEHAHHVQRRSQGGPDTPDNLLAVCGPCHSYLHTHVAWSLVHGFLKGAAA